MSHNDNAKSLRNKFKCKHCSKGYSQEWAKINHEKRCVWKEEENGYETSY